MNSNAVCNVEQDDHQSNPKFVNGNARKPSYADELEYFSNTQEDLKVQVAEFPDTTK